MINNSLKLLFQNLIEQTMLKQEEDKKENELID